MLHESVYILTYSAVVGNIDDDDDDIPNLPVTTIANTFQEENERFGVGRGGTGNYKRPPPASRFLHGSRETGSRGTGSRGSVSHGSLGSRRQSNSSGIRPHSPSRPSVSSLATGRSVQPVPFASNRSTTEPTLPSETAIAQFKFDFSGSESDQSNGLSQISDVKVQTAESSTQKAPSQQKNQNEQYHHPLQTVSHTTSVQSGMMESIESPPHLATTKQIPGTSSSYTIYNAPVELTALPKVQAPKPPSSMMPAPVTFFSPDSRPATTSSGTAETVHGTQASSNPDNNERFVYGRGGVANIARENPDGTIRQHRTLVDYLASKRRKEENSMGEMRKKAWWRRGKHSHHGTRPAGLGERGAELQPIGVMAE